MSDLHEPPDPLRPTRDFRTKLHFLLDVYAEVLSRSDLSSSSQATYFDMANNFVRWVEGEFIPGSRSFRDKRKAG